MKLFTLTSLGLISRAVAQSADLSSLLAEWSAIRPTITQSYSMAAAIPTRLGNVDPPPTSLMLAIFTGVPQNIIIDLMNPAGRASIASEFAAGNTPSWYQALPTGVKSYIESIHAAIATGGNDYTGTDSAPAIPNETAVQGTGTIPSSSGLPEGGGDGNVQATSKSKGSAPAPTWGAMEMLGLSGVVGVVGLAVGL